MLAAETATGEPGAAEAPQRDAIEALAVALLERDRYTGEHSEAVIEMSGVVARNLGLHADGGRAGQARRRCCTTSARSRSPTRSCTSPGR